jgi:hypothetical protein
MNSTVHLSYQLRATRALVKFIRDHNSEVDMDLLKCLEALEHTDISSAVKHAKMVKVAGMGGLTDWFPPVVFGHENEEYVWAELEALAYNWARLIALSFEGKP